jgi:hypothetical protein
VVSAADLDGLVLDLRLLLTLVESSLRRATMNQGGLTSAQDFTMTTHLYCVLPHHHLRGSVPRGLNGVSGGAVRALSLEGLVAWVSDIRQGVPISIDGVKAHDAVVEAALETGSTPVPARFGQRFENDEACRAALASRAPSVESLLETMQGLVEMSVIIAPSTTRMIGDLEPLLPEMLGVETGAADPQYLTTLRKRELRTGEINRLTDVIAAELSEAAGPYVQRAMVHQTATPLPLRTVSHLVKRSDLDAYRAAVSGVRSGDGFRLLFIGPRAPYSFCALTAEGGAHGMNLAD